MATQGLFNLFGETPEEIRAKYEQGMMGTPISDVALLNRPAAMGAGLGRRFGYSLGRMLGGRLPGEEKAMLIQEAIAEANSRDFAVPEQRYTALADALLSRGLEAEGMQAIDAARQARLNEIEEQQKRLGIKKTEADILAQEALAKQRGEKKDRSVVSERNRGVIVTYETKIANGQKLTIEEEANARALLEQETKEKSYYDKDTGELVTIKSFNPQEAAPRLYAYLKGKPTVGGKSIETDASGEPVVRVDGKVTEQLTPSGVRKLKEKQNKIQRTYDDLASELGRVVETYQSVGQFSQGLWYTVLSPDNPIGAFLPDTDARSLYNLVKSLKTGKLKQTLEALKSQSGTGATGLGQITEREISLLLADIVEIDPKDKNFKKQLSKVYARYRTVLNRIKEDMQAAKGKLTPIPLPSLVAPKGTVVNTTPSSPEAPATTAPSGGFIIEEIPSGAAPALSGTASGVVQDMTSPR